MTEFDSTADSTPDQIRAFNAAAPPSLGSLFRKAAVDAGFDLEPEVDGGWWRLRASGAAGVAWMRPSGESGAFSTGASPMLLALPLRVQIEELLSAPASVVEFVDSAALALPSGAAGAVRCGSATALHQALHRIWMLRVHSPERMRERWRAEVETILARDIPRKSEQAVEAEAPYSAPLVTEALAHVRRRVGQDVFREALMAYWGSRCAVTGLAVPDLLRASHAKPWAVASASERMDLYNGLLLAVQLDALFDRGLLTFDEQGRGIMSPRLSPQAIQLLGLAGVELQLRWVREDHLPYLLYHRNRVFQRV